MATGKPFAKGYDARREGNGRKRQPSLERIVAALEKKGAAPWEGGHPDFPDVGSLSLWEYAVLELFKALARGERWACLDVLDRTCGKPRQAVQLSGGEGIVQVFWDSLSATPNMRTVCADGTTRDSTDAELQALIADAKNPDVHPDFRPDAEDIAALQAAKTKAG